MLNNIVDKDGLVSTGLLVFNNGQIKINNVNVFIDPIAHEVAKYIRNNKDLWDIARFRIQEYEPIMARAPIFGVSFEQGLKIISGRKQGIVKSMYQRNDWKNIKGHAVVGSLLTHITYANHCITFEGWQLFDIDGETFYIHGEIDISKEIFTHLDGATMFHPIEDKSKLISHGSKIKGSHYVKHFRLDGAISMDYAIDIMRIYLPLEDLTEEFIVTEETSA